MGIRLELIILEHESNELPKLLYPIFIPLVRLELTFIL